MEKQILAKNNQSEILNVQPQALEAEQAVLGSMLISKEAVSKVLQWISSEHFYKAVSYTHLRAHET